jgi:hypothetical protein
MLTPPAPALEELNSPHEDFSENVGLKCKIFTTFLVKKGN